jgi:4,5-dihydroxyphthalate decarboxylase
VAKEQVIARAREQTETFFRLGWLPLEARRTVRTEDPFPYGVKTCRHVLETIAQYSHEQGLTPRVIDLEEIFAPSTMDL